MSDFKVLVIGAGCTGLLVAQGLKQAGISCSVYERTDADTYCNRQRDWTMGLHWGSDYLKRCLSPDLFARVPTAETYPDVQMSDDDATRVPIMNGKTGEILARIPGSSTRRVSREKLRRLLATDIDVHYSKRIVGLEDDGRRVTARFEDGTTAVGDALIGCDSATSFVRSFLVAEGSADADALPIIPFNFTSSFTADQAVWIKDQIHPILKGCVHPDHDIWYMIATADASGDKDPSTWKFQILFTILSDEASPATSEERMTRFKEFGQSYCEPFKSTAAWVDPKTVIARDSIRSWAQPVRWRNYEGRMTLAGDAAHPMPPYRAQGLNNGLQDAANYVEALTKVAASKDVARSLQAAIDTYDAEVLERGSKEIKMSTDQVHKVHHFESFLGNTHFQQKGFHKPSAEKE